MHLAHKHSLQPIQGAQFKFSRLRPPGFPTVRLAQLAAIVHRVPDIMLLAAEPWQVPEILRELELSPYWTTHYKPGQPSKAQPKRIGKQFVDTLLINCFIPIAVLYYRTLGKNEATNRVIDYMQRLKPENNRIVRRYSDYDFPAESALDTQGILHLERHYCRQSHCLSCAIGHQLMRAPKSSKTSSSS
jgi:hypothetical protein